MDAGTEREIDSKSVSNLPENQTVRQIFERNKLGALKNALKLPELIRGIELDDDWLDDDMLEDDIRMLALELARQLCVQLRNVRRLMIVIASES